MSAFYLTRYPTARTYQPTGFNGGRRLPLDVQDDSQGYVITAAVPGLKAEDVQIEILQDTVTLRARPAEGEAEQGNGYLLREIHTGGFERCLRLPDPVDASQAEASVHDGLLTLRLPKAEEARPKTIPVQAR
jgi:HSP20 family protein